MTIKQIISYALLIFIPVSIGAEFFQWGTLTIFITSGLAIVPLAVWLSTATEEIAIATGCVVGRTTL